MDATKQPVHQGLTYRDAVQLKQVGTGRASLWLRAFSWGVFVGALLGALVTWVIGTMVLAVWLGTIGSST